MYVAGASRVRITGGVMAGSVAGRSGGMVRIVAGVFEIAAPPI